jgi:hypothetical protein
MINITPQLLFAPQISPGTYRTEGWLGLRADLGVLENGKNILSCRKLKPGSSRAWPSRYTDYVTPASPRYCCVKIALSCVNKSAFYHACSTFIWCGKHWQNWIGMRARWHSTSRLKMNEYSCNLPIPVAAPSKPWFCGHWLGGIAGSNHTGGMDVCASWVVCFVR